MVAARAPHRHERAVHCDSRAGRRRALVRARRGRQRMRLGTRARLGRAHPDRVDLGRRRGLALRSRTSHRSRGAIHCRKRATHPRRARASPPRALRRQGGADAGDLRVAGRLGRHARDDARLRGKGASGIMSVSTRLRMGSIVAFIYWIGHTAGAPWTPVRGAAEIAAIDALRSLHFPVQGFSRSYWDFYSGFGIAISAFLLVQAALLWQLATLAKIGADRLRPMLALLFAGFLANAAVAW